MWYRIFKGYDKNVQRLIIILVGVIVFLGISCKKFVQISPPSTQVVTASVFSDNNAATAAVTVIYSQMQSESWNMAQNSGLLSDELVSGSTSAGVQPYYTNGLSSTLSSAQGPWTSAYNYIYQANAIIEGLRNYGGGGDIFRKQLTGEAEFIRAFWYFYLVNCYGDVPLAITTDYKINSALSRAVKTDVYQQIIKDLKDAQNLLDSNYVDADDTTVTVERIRPTKWAATALLARVYLYTGNYQDAELQSTIVISNSRYSLVQDLYSVFLMNSPEAIWQLGIPSPSLTNTVDGYNFILLAAPNAGPNAVSNTATISPTLLSIFEPNDRRKDSWIGSIITSGPVDTFYFPYKYQNNTPSITEYTMMLRLAEQFLIRAEARTQNSKFMEAAADLNAIRERAGLADYAGPLNKDSLLTAILHERQAELFVEWGHRWFDLIRTGNINTVMSMITPQKGGNEWKPEWALYPIPLSEMKIDFNLTQNDGY